MTVCRTGYTGEHGYELVCARGTRGPGVGCIGQGSETVTDCDPPVWPPGTPCAPRWAIPLHGQDLSMEISPLQAGSGWPVGWNKPAFWGREALLAEKSAGPRRRLWGLTALDRGIPRCHMAVLRAAITVVGEVTSGTFSPTNRVGIGLALLDTAAGLEPDARRRRRHSRPPVIDARGQAALRAALGSLAVPRRPRGVTYEQVKEWALALPGRPRSSVEEWVIRRCASTTRCSRSAARNRPRSLKASDRGPGGAHRGRPGHVLERPVHRPVRLGARATVASGPRRTAGTDR